MIPCLIVYVCLGPMFVKRVTASGKSVESTLIIWLLAGILLTLASYFVFGLY